MRRCIRALCLLLALLTPGAALALGPDSGTLYEGIDVSEFQGTIDFAAVRADGIEVVYIRAGLGADYTDPYFRRNVRGARAAGLRYGLYWYVTARDEAEARTQAAAFADRIADSGYACRPAMDFEQWAGLSAAQVNATARAFLEELADLTGVTPVLYTDAYNADRVYDAEFGAYPLWVANYGVEEPDVTSGYWRGWSAFQYSDAGRVSGIEGNVDRDRFTDGVLLGTPAPTPTSTPTSTPAPTPPPGGRYVYYTVRTGDTLSGIAAAFDTSVARLAALNDIENANRIEVGRVLRIPTGNRYFSYTVRPGDTLWAIARRFGTTVEIVADRNRIADISLLRVGERLWIPRRQT